MREAPPQEDGDGIHTNKKEEQYHNGGAGFVGEGAFGAVGPNIYLDGQDACGIGEVAGRVDDEGDHADHQQRRGFTERARHADDRAGEDAGQSERHDMMKDALHMGGADAQSGLAD